MRAWKLDDRVTLYRGDSRAILPKLATASIDLVFMDPPYGHSNNGGHDLISNKYVALGRPGAAVTRRPILNDGPEADELLRQTLPEVARLLRHAGCCCCCCCGGGGPKPQFANWSLWLDDALHFKHAVVWDKGKGGMGWHYRRCYEMVLVAQKGRGPCAWHTDSHSVWNVIRPGDGVKKVIPRAHHHPTEKPAELAQRFIELHTQPGDVVLDPFMGRGSTGVACLRTGRRFIGIELDPAWFSAARQRLAAENRHAEPPRGTATRNRHAEPPRGTATRNRHAEPPRGTATRNRHAEPLSKRRKRRAS